jgi:hypothetical protein
MAEAREVRVKLTADVDEYIAAMRRARMVTRRFNGERAYGYILAGVVGGGIVACIFGLVMYATTH